MYGFWIKPDRFINFQGLYANYLNQLKTLAYRFEDLFTGKTERFHEPGIDGYVIEAGSADEVKSYFTTYAMPRAQFIYTNSFIESGTITQNIIPGSGLVVIDYNNNTQEFLADNGEGSMVRVDGSKVGTIDYLTGNYEVSGIDTSSVIGVVIGYATTDNNTTYQTYDGAVSGTSAIIKEIKGGRIPGSQVGLSAHIIVAEGVRKFFVGFTTNSKECQSKIISKITDSPVVATDPETMEITPDSLTIAKGATGTATVSGGISPYTVGSVSTGVTATISGSTVTVAVDESASSSSAQISIYDNASEPNDVTLSVTIS